MWARRFLIFVVVLTLLFVIGAFLMFQFGSALLKRQMTPQGEFEAPPPDSGPDYSKLENWIAHPRLRLNPSHWSPDGTFDAATGVHAATFYIHPTTYLRPDRWNAPLYADTETEDRARLFVQSQASAFDNVGQVWAPRYRQAAYGAFLLKSEDAQKALDLAYRDVRDAFDRFLAELHPGTPIFLAGHSQGSLHLTRLLAERGPQLRDRLIAAYVVGWPVSVTADLPAMGLPPCVEPEQFGCVLSWQSFGEPGNPGLVLDAWEGTRGPAGVERRRSDMLCVNPITGTLGGEAPPQANRGTLVPTANMANASLEAGRVGARCEKGFLTITGDVPPMGPFVLPGNNYHVYDYALFWAAIRGDTLVRGYAHHWSNR